MKKLFFVLYACLCVGLWSCSNDDEPTVPNEKQDVVVFRLWFLSGFFSWEYPLVIK